MRALNPLPEVYVEHIFIIHNLYNDQFHVNIIKKNYNFQNIFQCFVFIFLFTICCSFNNRLGRIYYSTNIRETQVKYN